jgi:hypothetical protein
MIRTSMFAVAALALIGMAAPAQAQWHGYHVGGFAGPAFGRPGTSVNRIDNSGNGINNTIIAGNRAGFPGRVFAPVGAAPFYPQVGFPGHLAVPGVGGVNVNVITNSGNGVGNFIQSGNRGGPGSLNINVITNSGNGIGNTIRTNNRGW